MGEKIIHTEGGGIFKAVQPGDKFAGGVLTEAGATEVNASRVNVAEGLEKRSLAEKLAAQLIADSARRGATSPGAAETIARDITADDKDIFIRRR